MEVKNVRTSTADPPGDMVSVGEVNDAEAPVAEDGTIAEIANVPDRPLLENVRVEVAELPAKKADGRG